MEVSEFAIAFASTIEGDPIGVLIMTILMAAHLFLEGVLAGWFSEGPPDQGASVKSSLKTWSPPER